MKKLHRIENVFYPPVGIAHLTDNLAHLVEPQIKGKKEIIIKSSSQPNGHPHLGTIMTLMTAFALGEHLQRYFAINVRFIFDALENSPGETILVNNLSYQRSLKDISVGGISLADKYLGSFRDILNKLTEITGIEHSLRYYEDFQRIGIIRRTLLLILQEPEKFIPIVSPSEKRIHIRFPCPQCKYMDKSATSFQIMNITSKSAILTSSCFEHGEYNITLSESNDDFVDANTPLRDILQGVLSIEDDRANNTLTIMVDGGDWSGVWALKVFCEGLLALGYSYIPSRILAPVIVDWSGAKFSNPLTCKQVHTIICRQVLLISPNLHKFMVKSVFKGYGKKLNLGYVNQKNSSEITPSTIFN